MAAYLVSRRCVRACSFVCLFGRPPTALSGAKYAPPEAQLVVDDSTVESLPTGFSDELFSLEEFDKVCVHACMHDKIMHIPPPSPTLWVWVVVVVVVVVVHD